MSVIKETYAEIQTTLIEMGETITIVENNNTFLAILGFSTTLLQDITGMNSVVEQQNINMFASIQDLTTNLVIQNMLITYSDDTYIYTFTVMQNPIPQLDGWARLPVVFTDMVAI